MDLSKHLLTLKLIEKNLRKEALGLHLSYNSKQIELFTNDLDGATKFLDKFKTFVVQRDFCDKFNLKEKLGAGSYAEVRYLESVFLKVRSIEPNQ